VLGSGGRCFTGTQNELLHASLSLLVGEALLASLGNWASIESKDQSRVSASTISIKTAVIFTFRIRVQPNGLQLGCTITMRIRFLVLITQRSEVQIVPRNQGREQAALFIALAAANFGVIPQIQSSHRAIGCPERT
jgi:hypothetical protein